MKTMVLGAYHFCWEYDAQKAACSYYDQCVRAGHSRDFDELCPIYKDRMDLFDGYYRISNSNIIEVDSFLEGARYPSYVDFTRFMLESSGHLLTAEDKSSLWESVSFYNYIQHFLPEAVEFTYAGHKEDMDADFTAFSQALYELKPSLIYIWTDAVKDAVQANCARLDGVKLKFFNGHIVGSMTVWPVVASYVGEGKKVDVKALIAEAQTSWFELKDEKTTVRNILSVLLSYRNHSAYSGITLPQGKTAESMEAVLRPLVYDDDVITELTCIYQRTAGLDDILSQQENNIRDMLSDAKNVYSNFYYKNALPLSGAEPEWLALWNPGAGVDFGKMFTMKPLSRGDVMLVWIDEEASWSLILFQRVFDCMKLCGWKMLVLMKTEQSGQYLQVFKSSKLVNCIYEVQGTVLVEFTPEEHTQVVIYPDGISKPYSQFISFAASAYRKNKQPLSWFENYLRKEKNLHEENVVMAIARLLYDAQNSGLLTVVDKNTKDSIRCNDEEHGKIINLIGEIKNASKASRLGKNILPYDTIQAMLHTEIKNIEQRIHNQKTKSRIKRKSRKS